MEEKRKGRRHGPSRMDGPQLPLRGALKLREQAISLADGKVWDALRSPLRVRLLEAVLVEPGVGARRLADLMGTSASRVHYHLRVLMAASLVEMVRVDAVDADAVDVGTVKNGPTSARRGQRRSSRRSGANGFRSSLDGFPTTLFNGNHRSDERAVQLVCEVAASAIRELAKVPTKPDGRVLFAREALSSSEVERVQRHFEEIRGVIHQARKRRRSAGSLTSAKVMIGLWLGLLGEPSLPDGLFEWDAGHSRQRGFQ